ncbi:PEGA domain-containing protein [bacterium]|nr:PEGA domain-containing protein [bacterium]
MRVFIVYSVLIAFSFLSLTPAGVSLAELRADDDLDLDELDLNEDEDEEEDESYKKKAKRSRSSEDDEEDEEESAKDEEKDSEDEEDEEEDTAFSRKSAKSEEAEEPEEPEDDAYMPTGKKIAAFYFFEDSHTLKSVSHVAAETAKQLEASEDYDYVGTEALLFSLSSSSDMKKAKRDFNEGVALYNDDNPEDAVDKFKSALKYIENNMDKIPDMKFLSEVIFYLGASYKLSDEDKEAESYFSDYISINPDAKPDESKFSREVVSAFNNVKKNHGKAFKGSIRVSSNPDGALVLIDGKIAGITPIILRGINSGKHYYRIHKNGYRDAAGTVVVSGGRTASISETVTKYSQAAPMFEAEREMKSEFGQVSMLSKSIEIAKDLELDNILVINAKLGADERLNYTGYMVDVRKREYKKSEAVFDVPEKGSAARSASLKEFNKALIEDPYEYKSISDAFAAEVSLLVSDSDNADAAKDKKRGKPVYKEWWLWTVVGVVVLAGAGVGTYFALTADKSGSDGGDGATLKINFNK